MEENPVEAVEELWSKLGAPSFPLEEGVLLFRVLTSHARQRAPELSDFRAISGHLSLLLAEVETGLAAVTRRRRRREAFRADGVGKYALPEGWEGRAPPPDETTLRGLMAGWTTLCESLIHFSVALEPLPVVSKDVAPLYAAINRLAVQLLQEARESAALAHAMKTNPAIADRFLGSMLQLTEHLVKVDLHSSALFPSWASLLNDLGTFSGLPLTFTSRLLRIMAVAQWWREEELWTRLASAACDAAALYPSTRIDWEESKDRHSLSAQQRTAVHVRGEIASRPIPRSFLKAHGLPVDVDRENDEQELEGEVDAADWLTSRAVEEREASLEAEARDQHAPNLPWMELDEARAFVLQQIRRAQPKDRKLVRSPRPKTSASPLPMVASEAREASLARLHVVRLALERLWPAAVEAVEHLRNGLPGAHCRRLFALRTPRPLTREQQMALVRATEKLRLVRPTPDHVTLAEGFPLALAWPALQIGLDVNNQCDFIRAWEPGSDLSWTAAWEEGRWATWRDPASPSDTALHPDAPPLPPAPRSLLLEHESRGEGEEEATNGTVARGYALSDSVEARPKKGSPTKSLRPSRWHPTREVSPEVRTEARELRKARDRAVDAVELAESVQKRHRATLPTSLSQEAIRRLPKDKQMALLPPPEGQEEVAVVSAVVKSAVHRANQKELLLLEKAEGLPPALQRAWAEEGGLTHEEEAYLRRRVRPVRPAVRLRRDILRAGSWDVTTLPFDHWKTLPMSKRTAYLAMLLPSDLRQRALTKENV